MASGHPDWLRAFTMMGKHDTEYKAVLVDVDGNLYALLQGETIDKELKTVRLDDQGRMSAFVIDSVDAWNRMLSIGNAELAVRLGSPSWFDRRGQICTMCTFNDGWGLVEAVPDLVGSTISLSPEFAAGGGYSVHIALTNLVEADGMLRIRTGGVNPARAGLEATVHVDVIDMHLDIFVEQNTGARHTTAGVRIDLTAKVLQYFGTDTDWHTFQEGITMPYGGSTAVILKLVADSSEEEYVRFLFDGAEYDLSDYTVHAVNDDDPPQITARVRAVNQVAAVRDVWYDNLIVTVAEPT